MNSRKIASSSSSGFDGLPQDRLRHIGHRPCSPFRARPPRARVSSPRRNSFRHTHRNRRTWCCQPGRKPPGVSCGSCSGSVHVFAWTPGKNTCRHRNRQRAAGRKVGCPTCRDRSKPRQRLRPALLARPFGRVPRLPVCLRSDRGTDGFFVPGPKAMQPMPTYSSLCLNTSRQ